MTGFRAGLRGKCGCHGNRPNAPVAGGICQRAPYTRRARRLPRRGGGTRSYAHRFCSPFLQSLWSSRLRAAPRLPIRRGGSEPEHVAATSSAVINGQLDTTHQAVVAIVLQSGSQGGLCSGTIVEDGSRSHIGWVVAAAHVDLPPVFVLQGNDFSQASGVLRYDVIDYKADSRYGGAVGSPYDFAVLRIAGVDATTPTIPLASATDGLAVGTNVLSVGYGRTTLIASGAGTENTVRRNVAKKLGQVGQMIAY